MEFLRPIRGMFASGRIAGLPGLGAFIESRSAYLAQKSIMEYSQARANILFSALMREPLFLAAYETARWRSYPAALSMVCQMAEGALREKLDTSAGAFDGALVRLAGDIVSRFGGPSGLGDEFWREAVDQLRRDLAQAALGPPRQAQAIPFPRAQEIFDALPASGQVKQHDFTMFRNTIRLHLTEIAEEFDRKAEMRQLAAALADAHGPPVQPPPARGSSPGGR